MEEYKQYKDTKYFVSNQGNVIGPWKRKLKHLSFGWGKYKCIGINKQRILVHRMVAETFIPNPNNLRDVNHKDGNISNNCIDNLEWLSHSDNIKHSYKVLGQVSHFLGKSYRKGIPNYFLRKEKPACKAICVYTKDNIFIKEYKSATDASKDLNISRVTITQNCLGTTKNCRKGYIFRFKFDI